MVQSRIWYFQAKRAIDVDRASYDRFAAQDAAAARLDRALLDRLVQVQERMRAMTDPDVPAWQARAPTVDVSRKADDDHEAEGHDGVAARTTPGHGADEAPYPLGFQQVMEAVTSGQPVPGVRDIPNSIVRAPVRGPLFLARLRRTVDPECRCVGNLPRGQDAATSQAVAKAAESRRRCEQWSCQHYPRRRVPPA